MDILHGKEGESPEKCQEICNSNALCMYYSWDRKQLQCSIFISANVKCSSVLGQTEKALSQCTVAGKFYSTPSGGATTFSVTTLNMIGFLRHSELMTLSTMAIYRECCYAECH